ncbi:MAG: hypothetical protein D3903_20530, partial [Candidatus Electrothrix sp. GM3_4]|nr:hypothetical protein [Candidatus Electrothrix sp. GM3_4]
LRLWAPLITHKITTFQHPYTHNAVCHRTPGEQGKLIINPGAFQMVSRYGIPCSYAILEAGEQLKGALHELPLG